MTAEDVIAALKLAPHPEGGWYRETFKDAASTAIYFLLKAGEQSRWHRIAQAETWHWYAGAALALALSPDGKRREYVRLGSDLAASQIPQFTVAPGVWQSARSLGDWTLAGCTVAPPFQFSGLEMAPAGWEPA